MPLFTLIHLRLGSVGLSWSIVSVTAALIDVHLRTAESGAKLSIDRAVRATQRYMRADCYPVAIKLQFRELELLFDPSFYTFFKQKNSW